MDGQQDQNLGWGSERRKYDRYDTDLKIQFQVNFDIETKIDYQLKKRDDTGFCPDTYHAVSRNISAEGLSFNSQQKLKKGDILKIELFVPASESPVRMLGEVRWSHSAKDTMDGMPTFDTGVLVQEVNGEPVTKTIYQDESHNVVWSIVLEAVFTSFKNIMLNRPKS